MSSGLALDLTKTHFKFRRGDLFAVGTWVRADEEGWQSCLALYPAADEGRPDLVPCLVTSNQAWVWSEDIGDPRLAARTAAMFCEAMRYEINQHNMIFIASMIHDLLGDLLTIPPYPEREAVADVLVTNPETGASAEYTLVDV